MSAPTIAARAIAWLLLVIVALCMVAVVIDAIHAKEHRQGLARAGGDVELPQRREAQAAMWELQDGRGVHGFFIAPRSLSTPHNKVGK